MPDDVGDIADYYAQSLDSEKSRLGRHQLEFDLTWRYLERYLPGNGAILEVGAATGRYTQELAQRGYAVTAVDLSAALLAENKTGLEQAGLGQQVQLLQADARDLSAVQKTDFDAALIMGPLYHLIEDYDRMAALQQVFQRLKPGGVLFSAFISRFGIMGDLIKDVPYWIEDEPAVRSHLTAGKRPDEYPRGGFRAYFATVEEIAPLHERAGFEMLVLAGVEPGISADDESYNRLSGAQRQKWQDLLFEISTQPSLVGASRHLLYVGKK